MDSKIKISISVVLIIAVAAVVYFIAATLIGAPGTTASPSPSSSSPAAVSFDNRYMKLAVPAGWQLGETETGAVNIVKNNHILFINPNFQQASGVEGGRFAEIAQGAPSADAVVIYQPSSPCGSSTVSAIGQGLSRVDLFVAKQDKTGWCAVPVAGQAWYFSYVIGVNGGYINYYKPGEALGWVATMAYNLRDVNKLPQKDSADLNMALAEMTDIMKTLELKLK